MEVKESKVKRHPQRKVSASRMMPSFAFSSRLSELEYFIALSPSFCYVPMLQNKRIIGIVIISFRFWHSSIHFVGLEWARI